MASDRSAAARKGSGMFRWIVSILLELLAAALVIPLLWFQGLIYPGLIWLLGGYSAGYFVGACVHELGHFVCARAVSIQVRHLWVGKGPLILRRRIGETTFELRLNFRASGLAVPFRSLRYNRYAWMLFTLGGAIANATLLALLLLAFKIPWPSAVVADPRWGLAGAACAQAMLIVRNLRPRSFVRDGRTVNNDGAILWNLVREKTKDDTRAFFA